MTDKYRPTYDLEAFKAAFSTVDNLFLTKTALQTASELGFDRLAILGVVQTMKTAHFYKSMTSHADQRIWQDVYHVPSPVGVLYLKFTSGVVTEFLLLSFKEKDNG